jgi:lipoic acid synthetase
MKSAKPSWLKVPLPSGDRYQRVRRAVSGACLSTVCEEAHCPNIGECWNSGTATFLILGDICTRGCAFCAVTRGNPGGLLSADEPSRLVSAVTAMGLDYVVVTSVTRDDLPDGGASVFAACVSELKKMNQPPTVELLTPDYLGADLACILDAGPTVFAHNIEVIERLTPALRHPRFSYARSLETLKTAAEYPGDRVIKSSIMLGVGETIDEVIRAMHDLRDCGVQILALGQYLQPDRSRAPVVAYIPPQVFSELAAQGKAMGFAFVAAGPLVRTSYRAAEAYVQGHLSGQNHS